MLQDSEVWESRKAKKPEGEGAELFRAFGTFCHSLSKLLDTMEMHVLNSTQDHARDDVLHGKSGGNHYDAEYVNKSEDGGTRKSSS